ncbi:hypothetical protein BpHYR1_046697 [Brachionus plicatilis]|uniref:Uncharacterized protein n=1 Tax=Brachionus plicatilis TaxID=10195 RepID=A0A3M7RVG2_BRAPC|nr:hypothetical protein BpHYR1_046697 [Brachionus plicatilis]
MNLEYMLAFNPFDNEFSQFSINFDFLLSIFVNKRRILNYLFHLFWKKNFIRLHRNIYLIKE